MRAAMHIHTRVQPNSDNPLLGTDPTCKQTMTRHVFKTWPVFEARLLFEPRLLFEDLWYVHVQQCMCTHAHTHTRAHTGLTAIFQVNVY